MVNERDFTVPTRLCVGIALTTEPDAMRRDLAQLCQALQQATGVEVEPRGLDRYEDLLAALAANLVDLAWLPPLLALRASAQQLANPLALPVRQGSSSYWAALFSRSDSPVRGLEDLRGLRAAWVDPESTAGYLVIRAFLTKQGIDLAGAFAEDHFVGTHDAVTAAVLGGRADVGATFAHFDESVDDGSATAQSGGWGAKEVHIVARAGPIPSDVIAARRALPGMVQRLVQSALVDVQNAALREAARALLGAEGFVAPQPEHLAPLIELLDVLPAIVPAAPSLVPPRR